MFQLGETAVSPKHHHPEQAKCPAGLLKAANKDSRKIIVLLLNSLTALKTPTACDEATPIMKTCGVQSRNFSLFISKSTEKL